MLRLALALLLPLTVAACSGGTQPAALDSEAAASPQAESLPGPEPETVATAEPEADPVEAAVREYVAAANVAMSTGDTERFRRAVTPECTCLAFADTIESRYAQGSSTPGARWDVQRIRVADISSGRAAAIVSLSQSSYRVLAASGAAIEYIAASQFDSYVVMTGDSVLRVSDVDEL